MRYIVLILIVFLTACSCQKQYAKIHIVTKDPNLGIVALKIFDAKTGLSFGDGLTPVDFIQTKTPSGKNPTLSIIVYDKCYPMKWKLVEITNWVRKLSQTKNSSSLNNIEITVRRDSDCVWDN